MSDTPNKLKAIIIDDEPRARQMLEILVVENTEDVEILCSCGDLPEGVKAINKFKPDVVFLDIELPGYSGLQLLEFFNEEEISFEIIFTTAYSDYAIKAFQLSAIDYLLKPIQIDQLVQSIEKLKKERSKLTYIKKLEALKSQMNTGASDGSKKIVVPVSNGYQLIKYEEILYFKADGSYTEIFMVNGSKMVISKKLKFFEDLICNEPGFLRVHRSYIVYLPYVKQFVRTNGGTLILENDIEIPITSEKSDELFNWLKINSAN